MNVRSLVLRGAGAGAIAGALAFVVALVYAEPLIDQAIAYEGAREEATDALARATGEVPAAATPDIVSRGVQSTLGIAVGMVGIGVAFGLLVAVAYVLCAGRVGRTGPRTLAMLVAGGGFAVLYAVPFVKYPANPPAVGREDTITDRSGLYLLMIVLSVVVGAAAIWAGRRWRSRFGAWNAAVLAGVGFALVMGLIMTLLPSLGELAANAGVGPVAATETPQPLTDAAGRIVFPGFDADLLYRFRVTSFLTQALLWSALGLIFGYLVERLEEADRQADVTPERPVEVH